MKKRSSVIMAMLLVPALLHAAASPVFREGAKVVVDIAEGSDEETALRASSEELSEEWFLKYTTGGSLLRAAGWKTLEGILPLENAVVLEERDGAVAVYSMKTGVLVSFTFRDGKISSVAVID